VLPYSVAERLDRLAPDQRAGRYRATRAGVVRGSGGKWQDDHSCRPDRVAGCHGRRSGRHHRSHVQQARSRRDGLARRRGARAAGLPAGAVRVKTFHALEREILVDGGERVDPLLDRETVLRDMWPEITRGAVRALDDAFSRLKLDIGVTAAEVGSDPEPGPIARAFLAYESALEDAGGLDFDDLVARSVRLLEARPPLLRRWRAKCHDLLVDEMQDVDRTQLRLALLLAAPSNRIFAVGDDDQTYDKSLPVSRS